MSERFKNTHPLYETVVSLPCSHYNRQSSTIQDKSDSVHTEHLKMCSVHTDSNIVGIISYVWFYVLYSLQIEKGAIEWDINFLLKNAERCKTPFVVTIFQTVSDSVVI
jgi:hypothetical protein